jgi:hypothetical protein
MGLAFSFGYRLQHKSVAIGGLRATTSSSPIVNERDALTALSVSLLWVGKNGNGACENPCHPRQTAADGRISGAQMTQQNANFGCKLVLK